MKRVISGFILAIISIFSLSIKTNAGTNELTWTLLPLYSTFMAVEAEMDVTDERIYGLEIFIPNSEYHVIEVGNVYSTIQFRNNITNQSFTLEFRDFSNRTIGGWYTFDFASLGINFIVNEVYILISQSFSNTGTPGGYIEYLNTNDQVIYNYDYKIEIQWSSNRYFSDRYYISTIINVIEGARLVTIYIPESDFHTISLNNGTILSSIEVKPYDEEFYTNIGPITSYNFGSVSGIVKIDLLDLGYELNQIENIKIIVPQNYNSVPGDYINYLNTETYVSFNDNVNRYELYVDGDLYDEGLFRTTFDLPLNPTKTGFKFIGWQTIAGVIYDGGVIDENDIFNNVYKLYATFAIDQSINTDTTDPDANNFMANIFAQFNLNTTFGYIVVYLAVIMISLFALAKFNMPSIITIIVLLLITGFFMFLGFLPILMAIMAFGILGYMLLTNVGGGV